MQLVKRHSRQNKFLALILLFVAFDVICDNYIAGSFSNESTIREFCLFVGLLFLQIIFSPIQAGVSDFYGRKISLIVSIFFSLLSLIFVYLYDLHLLAYLPLILLINFSKGILGNTVPISWAAIGDMGSTGGNLRFSFALTTASYAVGYLVLIFLKKFLSDTSATLLLIISFIFVLFLCFKHFFDLKDAKFQDIRKLKKYTFISFFCNEILLIVKDIRNRSNQMIFLAWILWEISIYIIIAYYADFSNYKSSFIQVLMMVGYLCGTFSIKFLSKIPDSKMIRIGYAISVISLLPYFSLFYFVKSIDIVLAICYFFHAIGNAFLSPTMLSIISKNRKEHERGKIYGLAESGDTIAFLISGIMIITLKYLKLDIFFLVCISFIAVFISWLPYRNFEKITAKAS
jgi:MFS family permease